MLVMAAERGFDWVHYTTEEYVTLSVAPNNGESVSHIMTISFLNLCIEFMHRWYRELLFSL